MSDSRPRRHLNALELLVVSEACAFAFAIAYTVVLNLTLPPTDGAHGQALLADPVVVTIMSMAAGVAGLAAWPFVYFALRRRDLVQGLLRAAGLTLAWILIVTPQSGLAGMLGSFPVFVVGLLWCAATLRPLVAAGECERCGYNLTGNSSGTCPDCGTPTPHRRAQGDQGELFCMGCAYDLAGLESSRCPECGRAFDRDDPNSVSRSANCVRWRRLHNRMGWLYFASLLTGSAMGISASMTGAPSEIVRFVCIAGGAWGLVFLSARLLTRRVERKAQLGLLRVPSDPLPRVAEPRHGREPAHPRKHRGLHLTSWLLLVATASTNWPVYLSLRLSRGALDELADQVARSSHVTEPVRAGIFRVERSSSSPDGRVTLWLWPWSGNTGYVGLFRAASAPAAGRQFTVTRLSANWWHVAD